LPIAVAADCRSDIVFVIDSIKNLVVVKQFVIDITQGLKISVTQTHVGFVSFAESARTIFHLQQYYDAGVLAEKIWEVANMPGVSNPAEGISVSIALAVVMLI
jgi:hypothetical protein